MTTMFAKPRFSALFLGDVEEGRLAVIEPRLAGHFLALIGDVDGAAGEGITKSVQNAA